MEQYKLTSQTISDYRNLGFPKTQIANVYSNGYYLQSISSSPKIYYNNSQKYYYTNSNLITYQDTNSNTNSVNYNGVNTNIQYINNAYPYDGNIFSDSSNITNPLYSYASLYKNNNYIVNSPYNTSYITPQSIPLIANTPTPVANVGYYIKGQNNQSIPYIGTGLNYHNISSNNYFKDFNGKISYYNYSQFGNQSSNQTYDTKSYELDDELNTSKELENDNLSESEPQDTIVNINAPISNYNNLNYVQSQSHAVILPNYSSVNLPINGPIYTQNQIIQPPNITTLPPRIIRTGGSNILGSPVRMTIRSISQPANLRSSYSMNVSNINQSIKVPFSPIRYSITRPLVLSPMRYSITRPLALSPMRYSITRPLVLSPMRYSITRPVLLSPIRKYNFASNPMVSIPINKYNFASIPVNTNPLARYNIASIPLMNSPSRKYYNTSLSIASDSSKQKRPDSPRDSLRSSLNQNQVSSPNIITSPIRQNRFLYPHDARSPLRENQVSSPNIITSPLRQNRFLYPHDARSPLSQNGISPHQNIISPLRQDNANQIYNITNPLKQSREIEIARIVTPIRNNNRYKIRSYKVSSLKEK